MTYDGQCANLHEAHAVLAQTIPTRTDGRTMDQNPSPEADSYSASQKILNFMKPEGSLPQPQQAASSPCHDPD